ncbi:hypothetical protein D9757_005462 [Collybiopsis confluens]|uniref:Uncharacterized protein n=1 Tax=Collybiopsis confluens TaxID=2823264 RepID=A0A8H5M9P2_9AGAR|nr:hypothetical protein D9757_005462 [Collybiopsis confluens]
MEGDEHVPKEHLELLSTVLSNSDADQSKGEKEDEADDSWSEEEKDRFFAALSSHSPLRPDLIAECVGSKNISQVCVYLAVLEKASENSQTESLRTALDIAMEVSDDWLEVEEDQAKFFRDLELAWIPDADEGDEALDFSNERQEALKALSFPHLKAMDRLLQDGHNPTESIPPIAPPSAAESRNELELASDLTPAERRRLQKRLYMRRKRAEASGRQFDADTLKLQRGRPKKASETDNAADGDDALIVPPNEVAGDLSGSDSEDSENEEGDSQDNDGRRKRKRKRGKTKEQQAIETFNRLGIDSMTLVNENVNLFHLGSLCRLLKLYRDAYSPSTVSSLSFSVIRLLTVILTDFVTQVLHRSILLREQELQLKAQSKVWHLEDDDVKDLCTDNIEKALVMLGYATSKKEALEHLSASDGLDNDEIPEDGSNDEVGSASELDAPVQDDFPMLPERDTPLDLHPPTIRLKEDMLLQTSTDSQEVPREWLLPIKTDDEMLEQELKEEEALNKQDEVRERDHQQELWADYHAQIAAFRRKG